MLQSTRRKFLKETITCTAGIALGPKLSATELEIGQPFFNRWADIVIIGSGGAGLSAALAAHEAGCRDILILEKMAISGGCTRISGGYYNAVDPERQEAQGISDSIGNHVQQTLLSGRGRNARELVSKLCSEALPTLHWLESLGVRYEQQCVQLYGGLFPRGHVPILPSGFESYVDILIERCRERGIKIECSRHVTQFIRDPETHKLGVVARRKSLPPERIGARRAVIAASGGYAANPRMFGKDDPRLASLDSTNPPSSTGEIMLAAAEFGAYTSGCDFIECIPSPMRYSRFAIFVEKCIFVNQQGKRFAAEDERRDVLRDIVLGLPEKHGYCIVDNDGYSACPDLFHKKAENSIRRQEVFSAPSISELARKLRIPTESLERTIHDYNKAVESGIDSEFGRHPQSMTAKILKPPFWGALCKMSAHHTMGGLRINFNAEVLDWLGNPIANLFAAGEVTGGIHGASRLGGNAITDIHVFGRIAGRNAALLKDG